MHATYFKLISGERSPLICFSYLVFFPTVTLQKMIEFSVWVENMTKKGEGDR